MNWIALQYRIRAFPTRWLEYQLTLDQDIKIHGMPYPLKWRLEKWFNYPPHKDDKYFIVQGRKIWYHCFIEKDNFELQLHYKHQFPGHIWFEIQDNGVASILNIRMRRRFRNMGLGTMAFQVSLRNIEDRVTRLIGIVEREYNPEPAPALRWLQRQGFEVKELENGDYKVELELKAGIR